MTSRSNTSPAWRLERVHHVGITVSDIEQSIAFYRDMLGMTLVRRRPRVAAGYVARQTGFPGVQLSVASLQTNNGGPSIELAQYLNQQGEPLAAATNQPGSCHLCLVVADLSGCHADLKTKGVAFKPNPSPSLRGRTKGVWSCISATRMATRSNYSSRPSAPIPANRKPSSRSPGHGDPRGPGARNAARED
jgi:catechol 2,3-dioxygenase-like lactoylglutathione lyase family enzyme